MLKKQVSNEHEPNQPITYTMKSKLLIRIASGLLLFFALGHSIGHFTRHSTPDPKAQAVLKEMSDNKFDMFGSLRSYDENYTGMSLNLIFTLLTLAFVLWILSSRVEENQKLVRALLLPIGLCVAGFCITSFLFFFVVPAVTCLLAAFILIYAYLQLR
jgi:4-amino-4-deoxy-L-arabinose transferase-like glycosyltransferase